MDNKNTIKGILLLINSYFILPIVALFTIMWFLFGGLGGNETNYVVTLIECLVYIIISVILDFKFLFKFSNTNSRDKIIFVIGLIITIIGVILVIKYLRQ